MTSREPRLRPATPEDRSDCAAFLARLTRIDPAALIRLRVSGAHLMLWASPLGVIVRREVAATSPVADVTVSAHQLLEAVTAHSDAPLPPARDGQWRAELPPERGWRSLDDVPTATVRRLAEAAARAVLGAADPAAAGSRLLGQETLRLSGGGHDAAGPVPVPVRVVTVLERMGFLGAPDPSGRPGPVARTDPAARSDVVRFAGSATWIRAAAVHGSVFHRRPGTGLTFA